MKKLLLVSLFCLTGCLTTKPPVNPMSTTPTPKQDFWWQTPYRADTPKDKNPWLKFVIPQEKDEWHNPWKQENLTEYGVDVLPGTKPEPKREAF